ncbi:MAG: LamG-like jellyroll fold domain-containing protein, partial [Bacteroidia bacterium]
MKKILFLLFSLFSASFFSQTLSTSLTACYALNGNGTEPINSLTGILSAATTPTLDRFNNPNFAVHFNGTPSSFITLPSSPLLKPSNAVSFSGWVKFDNIIQSHYIVFAHNTCTSYHEGYTLVAQNLGPGFKLHAVKSSGACSPATQQVLSSSSNMLANTWYHVGAYIGNDSLKVYINGVLEGSAISINPSFNYNPGENIYLGGSNIAFNLPMNGSLDNVRFYNRKLSNTEFNQLYVTDPTCAQLTPACNNVFYDMHGNTTNTVEISSTGIPNTSTLVPALYFPSSNAYGFSIGPSFGFLAPNPTFWALYNNNYYYFDGNSYINTNHSDVGGSKHYGGSKNFIYSIDQLGQVYSYNGTGNATLLTTVPTSSNGILNADIVGDDYDNFYILKLTSPQALLVYNHSGVQLCSYSITGIPVTPFSNGGGLAIVGNTVTAATSGTSTALYYVGQFSGPTVNFTQTAQSFSVGSEFSSCPRTISPFTSAITAAPNSSISCITSTITLTANSTSTVVPSSYLWSGPGILTSISNQSVQVNVAGVYSCTMIGCPIAGSIASFTVLSGGAPVPTPTITSTNSLNCTNSTSTLSVMPNTLPYVFLWAGPGTLSSFTNSSTVINTGGTFSVTVTNTTSGCSATQTLNVPSSIASLTITASSSNSQVCLPSPPITLIATGATNYTWTPVGSTLPATGSMVVSNPTTTTVYTVTGSTGVCTGSTTVIVNVNSTPVLTVSGSPTVCSGSPTTLSASGAASYTWQPGNLMGSTVTVTPSSTTTYTIIGANGNCTASVNFILATVASPTIIASASPTIICQGSTSTLSATGALTYTWQPGSIIASSITASPLVTSIYTVSGTNILGCSSNSTVQLVVNNPTINFSPPSGTICIGQSATLTASGASSYTWNPGAFNTSSIVVTPTTNTTYTLISINGVCTSTNTIPISVAPLPTITAVSNFPVICDGG